MHTREGICLEGKSKSDVSLCLFKSSVYARCMWFSISSIKGERNAFSRTNLRKGRVDCITCEKGRSVIELVPTAGLFSELILPMSREDPRAGQWAHSTAQTKKLPVRANKHFLILHGQIFSLLPMGQCLKESSACTRNLLHETLEVTCLFCPSVLHFSATSVFTPHIPICFRLSHYLNGQQPCWVCRHNAHPESCPVSVRNRQDSLIWNIPCDPAGVFEFFLLLMQLPVASVAFKIASEMLNTNTQACLCCFLPKMLNIWKDNLPQKQVLDSSSNLSVCLCHWFEMKHCWE